MDNLCPTCGGQLGTSQFTESTKKEGKNWYLTYRRCTSCKNKVIVNGSSTPPFTHRKKALCHLRTVQRDGY